MYISGIVCDLAQAVDRVNYEILLVHIGILWHPWEKS